MHFILPDEGIYEGFLAFRKIFTYIPIFWPLLLIFYFLPLVSKVGPVIYTFVAARRPKFKDLFWGKLFY